MAVIGGFRSDLWITRKTDGNFGNISGGVLFPKLRINKNGGKDSDTWQGMQKGANFWTTLLLFYHTYVPVKSRLQQPPPPPAGGIPCPGGRTFDHYS